MRRKLELEIYVIRNQEGYFAWVDPHEFIKKTGVLNFWPATTYGATKDEAINRFKKENNNAILKAFNYKPTIEREILNIE